jgi:hypothetical protein
MDKRWERLRGLGASTWPQSRSTTPPASTRRLAPPDVASRADGTAAPDLAFSLADHDGNEDVPGRLGTSTCRTEVFAWLKRPDRAWLGDRPLRRNR